MEKVELEKQIAEYVKEADYLYAHYHQRALRKVNRTLDTLKRLENPLYSRIREHQMYIDNCRKMLADPEYVGGDYLKHRIKHYEDKILELKSIPVTPSYDSQEIDDAIFSLVNGEISGFKFYFKSTPDVYADFTKSDDMIHIQICSQTDGTNDYQYLLSDINKFKALGFILMDGNWVYTYDLTSFKDALEIKIVLARLIYEVFHYDRRFDEARIVLG